MLESIIPVLQIEVPSSPLLDKHTDLEQALAAMADTLNPSSFWEIMADITNNNNNNNAILHDPSSSNILFNDTLNASITNVVTTATATTGAAAVATSSGWNSTFLNDSGLDGAESSCSPNNSFMVALPWIRITFGLLMVGENLLSLLALWAVKRMQPAVHRFITSLAVAELLMGVWCCYRYSAEILMASDSLTLECRLRFVGITYLNFVAILSVCALCLDRCLALHVPFRYAELVTKRRVRVVLGAIWTLPILFVLTAYLDLDTRAEACAECSFIHVASQRTYIVLTVLRCVLIAVIIVSELLIFRSARCQIIKIYPHVFSSRNSNRFLKMNAKAAFTTLAVVVPFLVLYFPVLLVQGNLAVRPHAADSCQGQLLAFVWLFASAHGLFTPFIFCWRFSEVRQNLVRLLCCVRTVSQVPSGIFRLRTTNDSACTV